MRLLILCNTKLDWARLGLKTAADKPRPVTDRKPRSVTAVTDLGSGKFRLRERPVCNDAGTEPTGRHERIDLWPDAKQLELLL
jgi:hypothetical protein